MRHYHRSFNVSLLTKYWARRPGAIALLLVAAWLSGNVAAAPPSPLNQGAGVPQTTDKWYSKLNPWNKAKAQPNFKHTKPQRTNVDEPSDEVKTEGQLSLARLSERRGQPEQAKSIYRAIIAKLPQHPVPHHRLGVMAAREGKFEECDRWLSRALELDPENPDLLNDIGYCLYVRNLTDDAESFYRRALNLRGDHEGANNNLAVLLAETGRQQESLAHFKRVNNDARAHANQAYILSQVGELDRAQEHFRHALTLDSSLRPAAHGLLQVASHQDQQKRLAKLQQATSEVQLSQNQQASPAVGDPRISDRLTSVPTAAPVAVVADPGSRIEHVSSSESPHPAPAKDLTIRPTSEVDQAPLPLPREVAEVPASLPPNGPDARTFEPAHRLLPQRPPTLLRASGAPVEAEPRQVDFAPAITAQPPAQPMPLMPNDQFPPAVHIDQSPMPHMQRVFSGAGVSAQVSDDAESTPLIPNGEGRMPRPLAGGPGTAVTQWPTPEQVPAIQANASDLPRQGQPVHGQATLSPLSSVHAEIWQKWSSPLVGEQSPQMHFGPPTTWSGNSRGAMQASPLAAEPRVELRR